MDDTEREAIRADGFDLSHHGRADEFDALTD
jgi:hypothetical protein